MVSQSDQGVTYLAYDKEARCNVELRRFFPYGRDGAAFGEDQQQAYHEMCLRLMGIKHPNLRVVVGGGVDPADKTPYLVTEWIRGRPLSEILGGVAMEPSKAAEVVLAALNASLALSEAFGQEAVWVDTMLDSIIVDEEPMGRGYTFWICPSRWFHANPKLREVSSVAFMAEKLVGWNARLYSKEAAGGFGGLVQAMKGTPKIHLKAALEQVEALIQRNQPQPTADPGMVSAGIPIPQDQHSARPKPVRNPVIHPKPVPVVQISAPQTAVATHTAFGVSAPQAAADPATLAQRKPKSLAVPMMFIAACIAVTSVSLYLLQRNHTRPGDQIASNHAPEETRAQKLAEPHAGSNPDPQIPSPSPSKPTSAGSAVAPADAAASKPVIAKPAATASSTEMDAVPVFSPDQVEDMRRRGNGKPVKLNGTVVEVRRGPNNNVVQLWFDTPEKKGMAWARGLRANFEGEWRPEMFEQYRGKRIVVEGAYAYDKNRPAGAHTVDFTRASQVYLAEKQPVPSAP